MEVFSQHNAWIATMISATAGTGSFVIALIANREKVCEFGTKHWRVILGLFTAGGLWSLYEYGALAYLMRLGKDLIGVRIPIWAIFAAIIFVIVARWTFRIFVTWRGQENDAETTRKLSLEDFRVEDYTEDFIDGVWWNWTYSGTTVNVPKPICPDRNCQCDLFFREDWNRINDGPNVARIGAPPVSLLCPRCNFRMDFNKVQAQVLREVTQEILSQIRTYKFRGRLYNRALNKQSGHA